VAHTESTILIERPPEEIFDFLADGTNNPKWRPGVTEITLVSGNGVGAIYKQTMRGPGGRNIAGDYRVVEADRPRVLRFEVIAGPARPRGTFRLEPAGTDTTQLTFSLNLQPTGVMRLMTPMIKRQMRREVSAVTDLKGVLETTAP
jgi:uncharacterized protein YndB with AHSA1/START domain